MSTLACVSGHFVFEKDQGLVVAATLEEVRELGIGIGRKLRSEIDDFSRNFLQAAEMGGRIFGVSSAIADDGVLGVQPTLVVERWFAESLLRTWCTAAL